VKLSSDCFWWKQGLHDEHWVPLSPLLQQFHNC
jgi:hypothetical protein